MNKVLQGDALTKLKELPDESVNCIVTSPPYWGLRDYGVEGQLGLEKTFEEYIDKLCDIFDEVKRVTRNDGTCWVNLGDTYNNSTNGGKLASDKSGLCSGKGRNPKLDNSVFVIRDKQCLPTKSLCLIPFRFAIEMVNRGWICRNVIIWHKPNCMPSSAKDRFTVDFEYLFFFVKNKKYWFEQQFEPHLSSESEINRQKVNGKKETHYATNKKYSGGVGYGEQGRNKRTVWTIPTKPYPEAHFAVYPAELIRTCIKAGCPKYVCKKCGKAREKVYEKGKVISKGGSSKGLRAKNDWNNNPNNYWCGDMTQRENIFKGYTDCGCNVGFRPGVVLDPFIGSGTTAEEAIRQGKNYIGIELKDEYIELTNKRLNNVQVNLI